jgi:Xaa-Pro aminopeptidase
MAKAQDLKRGSSGGERIEALQASMNEHGVDLVIVRRTTNMRYLTGYGAMAVERITVLLVTRDRVAMVMPYFDADEFRDATGRPSRNRHPLRHLCRVPRERAIPQTKIGGT